MAAGIDRFTTATHMLRALRARTISAVELLDLHLERIGRHNARVNATRTSSPPPLLSKQADASESPRVTQTRSTMTPPRKESP